MFRLARLPIVSIQRMPEECNGYRSVESSDGLQNCSFPPRMMRYFAGCAR